MYPNVTNLTGINSTVSFFRTMDAVSGGALGTTTSLVIYGLLFIGSYSMSQGDGRRAFVAASFASFIVNLFMVNIELLNPFAAAVPLIIFGISLFVK